MPKMIEEQFALLTGLVLERLNVNTAKDEIEIQASGRKFMMQHRQDCCESVRVDDVQGDIQRALGEKIIDAVEHTNSDEPRQDKWDESWTWTFYTIRTQSETIVIRWYGTSNGYYSESVDFYEVLPDPL